MEINRETRFRSMRDKFSCAFDYLIHIIILAVLCYILWISINHYRYLLSWHAILGAIAVLLLMSEALILFSSDFLKTYQRWIHGVLFFFATGFFVLSTCFEYHNKSTRTGHRHFRTAHGVTSLMATILAILTCILGFSTSRSELFSKYIFEIRPVVFKLLHNVLGVLVYFFGILSLCCAYYSNWLLGIISSFERIFLVLMTLIIGAWTLKHALQTIINLVKGEFNNS